MEGKRARLQHFIGNVAKDVGQDVGGRGPVGKHPADGRQVFGAIHQLFALVLGQSASATGGWRAVIGEGYTLANVRRLCQAIANETIRAGLDSQPIVVGGDRRFLSRDSAVAAAEVFAGNNIPVVLLPDDVPTPLVTFAAPYLDAAYGVVITDGPLAGLLSRAVVVLDQQNRVLLAQQVPEIAQEPDYASVLECLR